MTLSVKPFACMPSSGVGEGAQSVITELDPKLPMATIAKSAAATRF